MNAQNTVNVLPGSSAPARYARFEKVTDSRGNPIRRLWRRNQRFYAQIRVPGKRSSVKVPLVTAAGVAIVSILFERRSFVRSALINAIRTERGL